jgi:hypothetical protein
MACAIVTQSGERKHGGSEMLPEHMREALWRKVSNNFGTQAEGVKKAALWLQDAGHADEEIMMLIRLVWSGGYSDGFTEGYQGGRDEW